ncbi:MAG: aminoglycoside phosphotransferase family protein [Chloroflexi bacterium]|nr:aminoglycoside phosphotransferase family protein [Chloroflexota bacterium]
MSLSKMHDHEVEIDSDLVRRLLADRCPQWAHLPLERVVSSGTDNAMFRLGEDKVVRMPRVDWAARMVEKEHRYLATLAPRLPLPIPVPLVRGEPAYGYPWHWSVNPWLEGRNAFDSPVADLLQGAADLAQFVRALRRIDPADGPGYGAHNVGRGEPLANRDPHVRAALEQLDGLIDTRAAQQAWEESLVATAWDRPPVWIHGDLLPGNVLVQHGRISAIIDFGCLGTGDPAYDLIPAWSWFGPAARSVFRAAVEVDDATWLRGRGVALAVALVALPYYKDTNWMLADIARYTIAQVLGAAFDRAAD